MTTAERQSLTERLRRWLLDLPRPHKRAFLVIFDFVALSGVLWALLCLRYNTLYWPSTGVATLVALSAPVITVITFAYAGLYKLVTRYLGSRGHTRIMACVAVSVLVWSQLVFMSGQLGIPRTVVIAYGVIAALTITVSRHLAAAILKSSGVNLSKLELDEARKPVLIYGAGQTGVELAQALSRVRGRDVVGFCDNSPTLWGQYISGIKVYRPEKLNRIIERLGVKEILLAIPAEDRNERRLVLKELENYPVAVKVLPSLEEIASGRVSISDLRPLEVDDLLGRDPVPPNPDLLARIIKGKCVLVTGAGGSVGSELVRQVLRQSPRRVVLFDVSESALYEIEIEVKDIVAAMKGETARPEIVTVLGSILEPALVTDVLRRNVVQTIYHAAAYKHVPIVEHNPAVGLNNNIFGTEVVADAALTCGVEHMVLISTDKAVRPTNVMGASKRLAELVLQARAALQPTTIFTMVRFGNVLDSSGSVVRLFRRQIRSGGPVTVTHPEVIRYFMSIPEAAELVIQAGAMAQGGDVFVLDMGEPVKIDDLARLMIRLSGLELRDEANPDGDIEIAYTGLRPGEKLFEELLIGANTTGTEHLRILRSDEPSLTIQELQRELDLLKAAMAMRDSETIQAVLMRTVEGYRPESDTQVADNTAAAAWVAPSRTLH